MQRSWIYAAMRAGRFPRSIKAGAAAVWDSQAIEAYISRRADEAGKANAAQPPD